MSSDIAKLIVELTHKIEGAFAEADEARQHVAELREQRSILLQQLHETEKRRRDVTQRLHEMVNQYREMRRQFECWRQAAA